MPVQPLVWWRNVPRPASALGLEICFPVPIYVNEGWLCWQEKSQHSIIGPAAGPIRRSNPAARFWPPTPLALAVRTGRQRLETVMNTIDQKLQMELESA